MSEATVSRLTARELLRAAAELYDDPHSGLHAAARGAAAGGFRGGAEWMRLALAVIRRRGPAPGAAAFHRLGILKYALASTAALCVVAVAWLLEQPWLLPLAIPGFYLVEVRMVFAFPLALDGVAAPLTASHRLVARHHGALDATWTVMQLAAVMLAGGFPGHGFLRAWCLGCLGVLLWYERLRALEAAA